MKNKLFVLLGFIFLMNTSLFAGWVITQQTYDSDQGIEEAVNETIYLQNNIMKVVQNELVTVFDLNKEIIIVMSPQKQVYWTGKVSDYKKEIKAAMQAAMEEQLKNAAEGQKEMIRKMYTGMMESVDNPAKFADEEPEEYDLQIEKTKEKEKIAGYTAVKYKVVVNGAIKEEAWLSESNRAHSEFDVVKFYQVFGDFTSQAESIQYYQKNDKYTEFSKLGFPLKSIYYYGGYETISEISNLEKKDLSESEFTPPSNFKKVNLMEIGLNGQE